MEEEIKAEDDDFARLHFMLSRRVLVVDDNIDNAEIMAAVLRESGHEVYVAHDGRSAVAEARRLRPEFLFLDLGLPGLDGFQVAETLRREPGLEAMRIIAVTAYGQESDRRRAREAGFDQHLVKPVDMAFVESMLGGAR